MWKQISRLLIACLLSQTALVTVTQAAQLEPYTEVTGADFTLTDLNQQTHSLSEYRGKVVLVNFWASWCGPCIYEMPELTELKKQLANQPFEIIALNVGEKKYRVEKFVKQINLSLPVLLDTPSKTFDDWSVKTLPTSFLIDAEGFIRYRVRGNPGWDKEQTLSIIENLLKETNK